MITDLLLSSWLTRGEFEVVAFNNNWNFYVESDKTLPALTKSIRNELLPTLDETNGEGDCLSPAHSHLPIQTVETAIKLVVNRNNYGLDGTGTGKLPAAVCVWRWEVKDEYRDWLPKNAQEKAEVRMAERAQVRCFASVSAIFLLISGFGFGVGQKGSNSVV